MSVIFVTGKPGDGKSYYGVLQAMEELHFGDRYLVTNLPLLMPEVRQFVHEEFKEEVDTLGRVRILSDEETAQFWCYEPGRDFMGRKEVKIRDKQFTVPDFEDRAKRGCLYVIDEVHIPFGARNWQNTGDDAMFFLSQHRKLKCDCIFITQHVEQVDKAFRRLTQEYVTMRNMSRAPFMGFHIGNFFSMSRSLHSPTQANPGIFERHLITLKVNKYGKLYDTMAGVGIAGRVTAKNVRRGRSKWWLLVPLVLAIYCVLWGPKHLIALGESGFEHYIAGIFKARPKITLAGTDLKQPVAQTNAVTGQVVSVHAAAAVVREALSDPVYMSGHIRIDGVTTVYLSDGREYHLGDGECTEISPSFCVVNERVYRAAKPAVGKVAEFTSVVREREAIPVASNTGGGHRTLRLHFADGESYEKPMPVPREFVWQNSDPAQPATVSELATAAYGQVSTGSLAGAPPPDPVRTYVLH